MTARSPFRADILKGKTALVTGGGSGICYGIAEAFGEHGASLVLMGRRQEVLDEAVAKLKAKGITATGVAGDVRDFNAASATVAAAVAAYGHLDILVNGAAGNFLCPTDKLSPGGFKTVIDIDLLGSFNMAKAAFEALKATRNSLILNISATLHYQGTMMQAHVMAAKAGVDALGRNLACEWAEHGIRVCGIAPGPIGDTEGMRRLAPLGADKRMATEVPLGRLGKVQDIGFAALFLASEGASYITGETLVVDGGQWLAKPAFISRETWEKIAAKTPRE